MNNLKTIAQVKQEFAELGLSVAGWANRRGYSQALVYRVLSGESPALRGQSHKIAVELGLKAGRVGSYDDLEEPACDQ